jgi:hypothetical protein
MARILISGHAGIIKSLLCLACVRPWIESPALGEMSARDFCNIFAFLLQPLLLSPLKLLLSTESKE